MTPNIRNTKSEVFFLKLDGIDNINQHYETIDTIGVGSFGTVYKMISHKDNAIWAVKQINRNQDQPQHETQILSSIKHQNIIFIKELIETNNYYYLIMEFCPGGSLKEYQDLNGPLNELEIKHVMRQLAEVVSYLHGSNIAHRDLKTENLLLKKTNVAEVLVNDENNRLCLYLIKLIDFGLSMKLKKNEEMMLDLCGTPMYMPPEMIEERSYSKKCDIWSMGIVMLIMMLGRYPFTNSSNLKTDIVNFDIVNKPLPEGLDRFSVQCKEALQGLLNPDPIYRRSASEFLHFPWITGKEEKNPMTMFELMKMPGVTTKKDDNKKDSRTL